jgi:hypothetical protein
MMQKRDEMCQICHVNTTTHSLELFVSWQALRTSFMTPRKNNRGENEKHLLKPEESLREHRSVVVIAEEAVIEGTEAVVEDEEDGYHAVADEAEVDQAGEFRHIYEC